MKKIDSLEFKECDTCAAKPGSPILCIGCLNNRYVIDILNTEVEHLMGKINELIDVVNTLTDKPKEVWRPTDGVRYWYVGSEGYIYDTEWDNYPTDEDRYNFGNCFETEAEAVKARDAIKKLLSELK